MRAFFIITAVTLLFIIPILIGVPLYFEHHKDVKKRTKH